MRKIKFLLLGLFAFFGAVSFTVAFSPLAKQLVMAVLWYQNSDEMKAIYLQTFNWGKKIIAEESTKPSDKPYAVVVDIDETMLDNSPFEGYLIKHDINFSRALWNEWVNLGEAKALPGAANFTLFARDKGVEVFYISNRSIETLDATLKNLQNEGFAYADADHILLKTTTSDKTARRAKVTATHNVILYVGDNMGDFDQSFVMGEEGYSPNNVYRNVDKFGAKYLVLPNPMYGNWEHRIYPRPKMTPEEKARYRVRVIKSFKKVE